MIDGKNFFDQPVKYDLGTYESIWKIATGQEDYYTTGCLLENNYYENYCKMIAIDLNKQETLDAGSKARKLILLEIDLILIQELIWYRKLILLQI